MIQEKFFKIAFNLARSVKGTTSPNPAVGALVVQNGKIIGRGATQPAGHFHAEVLALKEAGTASVNAEMFVTLEPCVFYEGKRTPACTDLIIRSGIRKIHIGMKDPNPHINGRGILALQDAGIEVTLEEDASSVYELNEDFFKYIQTGIPFVTAKYAMTLDGNIATCCGDSKWISNEKSRSKVHEIRNQSDAVLVGIGTVLKDNPRLDVRLSETPISNPLRVIIDPRGETPPESNVITGETPSLFVIANTAPESFRQLCAIHNKEILEIHNGNIGMKDLVQILGNRSITSLLIEGGGRVLHRAQQEGIIDKYLIFIAPRILGGHGISPFNGPAPDKMSRALNLKQVSTEILSGDIFIKGYA